MAAPANVASGRLDGGPDEIQRAEKHKEDAVLLHEESESVENAGPDAAPSPDSSTVAASANRVTNGCVRGGSAYFGAERKARRTQQRRRFRQCLRQPLAEEINQQDGDGVDQQEPK